MPDPTTMLEMIANEQEEEARRKKRTGKRRISQWSQSILIKNRKASTILREKGVIGGNKIGAK